MYLRGVLWARFRRLLYLQNGSLGGRLGKKDPWGALWAQFRRLHYLQNGSLGVTLSPVPQTTLPSKWICGGPSEPGSVDCFTFKKDTWGALWARFRRLLYLQSGSLGGPLGTIP